MVLPSVLRLSFSVTKRYSRSKKTPAIRFRCQHSFVNFNLHIFFSVASILSVFPMITASIHISLFSRLSFDAFVSIYHPTDLLYSHPSAVPKPQSRTPYKLSPAFPGYPCLSFPTCLLTKGRGENRGWQVAVESNGFVVGGSGFLILY